MTPGGTFGPGFPETRGSVVEALRDDDPDVRRAGFEGLAAGYWRPVYKYLRLRGRLASDEAEDGARAPRKTPECRDPFISRSLPTTATAHARSTTWSGC